MQPPPRKLIFTIIILLVTLSVSSCGWYFRKRYSRFKTRALSELKGCIPAFRDSLLVNYTAVSWMNEGYGFFGVNFMMFDICADDFQFSTPYAFYSPDSLRAIFWSVRSHPNASYRKTFNDYSQYPNMCNSNLTYVHDMECLVGYRSNLDQVWQLRSLFAYHAGCSPNVDELAVFFYNYFFMQYKNEAISVDAIKLNDPFGGAVVPINEYYIDHPDRYTPEKFRWKYIGYNLGDADFWTKALLWQKDIRLKGYYSFEYLISGNDYIFPPTVVYPDSITRLYQRPER